MEGLNAFARDFSVRRNRRKKSNLAERHAVASESREHRLNIGQHGHKHCSKIGAERGTKERRKGRGPRRTGIEMDGANRMLIKSPLGCSFSAWRKWSLYVLSRGYSSARCNSCGYVYGRFAQSRDAFRSFYAIPDNPLK